MAIADKVKAFSVSVFQNNFLTYFRQIRLSLKSGGTAFIQFPEVRPADGCNSLARTRTST